MAFFATNEEDTNDIPILKTFLNTIFFFARSVGSRYSRMDEVKKIQRLI